MNILDTIVTHKQREIARLATVLILPASNTRRSLRKALSNKSPAFILECKSRSPSCGQLIRNYCPKSHAKALASFADVISVLTDKQFFGGDFEHVKAVRSVYSGPIVAKDFFLSEYQIAHAAAVGADAVLLMLRLLDDAHWQRLNDYAVKLGIETITEVDDADTLNRAIHLGAPIIGLNNRNFNDLSVNSRNVINLLEKVPKDRIAIVESGIRCVQDWRQYRETNRRPNAFLIGTALGTEDVDSAVRQLLFGEIKVCGLRKQEDAELAYHYGATWGGMIFAESPRKIDISAAQRLQARVPQLRWVGVFGKASPLEVVHIAKAVPFAALQLHGNCWQQQTIDTLRAHLPDVVELWRASQIIEGAEFEVPTLNNVDRYVIEPIGPKLGGNGKCFESIPPMVHRSNRRWVIAGGIGPENAVYFREKFSGVLDVNSKIEQSPGVKCQDAMRALFKALKQF